MPSTTTTSSPVGAPAGTTSATPSQYDDVADAYDRLIRPKYDAIAAHVACAARRCGDLSDAVVLELSAGPGTLTRLLAPAVGSYVATDVSRPMLDVARGRSGRRCARVAWLRADVEAVPLPGHLADLVVSSLGPVQDSQAALAEARRMAVPGGRLLACTWGDDYAELALLQDARRRLDLEPRSVTTAPELAGRLRGAGFHDVEVTEFRLPAVHESIAAYQAYRRAFGAMPLPDGVTVDDALAALADAIRPYVDGGGRVVLDWHLLLATGRA